MNFLPLPKHSITTIMRGSVIGLVSLLLFFQLSYSRGASAQKVLDQKVSIQVKNKTLEKVPHLIIIISGLVQYIPDPVK